MTFKINKSAIPHDFDFSAAVAKHAKDLTDWTAHDSEVKAKRADPYPPPMAPYTEVNSAIRRNADGTFEPDFEILDDSPTPAQILRAKKNELLNIVGGMEASAIMEALPLGRRRLRQSLYAKTVTEVMERAETKKRLVIEVMTADELLFLYEYTETKERIEEIEHTVADIMNEIEDQTSETIDAYQIPPIACVRMAHRHV
jgi:CRISPR/Cas system CSM-associated protein Csm2 small subunit